MTSSYGDNHEPERHPYDPLLRLRDHSMASPEDPPREAHEARASARTVDQTGARQDRCPTSPPPLGTNGHVRAASRGDLAELGSSPSPGPAVPAAGASEPRHEIDLLRAARAVSDLLDALGVERHGDSLTGTPGRVARAYAELLTPEPFEATTFANDEGYDELVVARSIPFSSLCEHHLLPFSGVAHVGYLPGERLIGLSKLARVVTHFSRRLQVQERLTTQVAGWLDTVLRPKGVGVVLEAEHACMSLRGVRAAGSATLTSALAGIVRDDERTRAEFFSLVGRRP